MSASEVVIPDFQSMMLPFLQILGDGKERFRKDIDIELAIKLNLTDTQRNWRYESGVNVFTNNLTWVEVYLFRADLIAKPQKGSLQITASGQALLQKKPDRLNVKFLKDNYPAVAQWLKTRTKKSENNENTETPEIIAELPEEQLKNSHSILCSDLAQELLSQVKSSHWRFFERLVLDLLTNMGYGGSRQDAAKVVGKSGDNGIDGVINEDKLGLDVVYIQAKKYTDSVTISQVRDFAGALLAKKARKGVFITTSSFPKSAEEFVAQIEPKVILIDGQRLAELMIEYNVGVAVKDTYEVKRIDYDYFDENEL